MNLIKTAKRGRTMAQSKKKSTLLSKKTEQTNKQLTENLKATLKTLEGEIESGIKALKESYMNIGSALYKISKDKNLYMTAGYDTFSDYCENKWKISRSYANRLVNAFLTVKMLPRGNKINQKLLETEKHVREINRVKDVNARLEVLQYLTKKYPNKRVSSNEIKNEIALHYDKKTKYFSNKPLEIQEQREFETKKLKFFSGGAKTTKKGMELISDDPEYKEIFEEFCGSLDDEVEMTINIKLPKAVDERQ